MHIFLTLSGCQMPTRAAVTPQLDTGEKIEGKAHGSRQGWGKFSQQLLSWTEQTQLGEIN